MFLFDAQILLDELKRIRVKIGVSTSVRQRLWTNAQIYSAQTNNLLKLSGEQRGALALFGSGMAA